MPRMRNDDGRGRDRMDMPAGVLYGGEGWLNEGGIEKMMETVEQRLKYLERDVALIRIFVEKELNKKVYE